MKLATLQERTLIRQAAETSSYKGLMYFYFARGERERVRDLESAIDPANAEDALTSDLILHDDDEGRYGSMLERLDAVSDPWIVHTLAKLLLLRGRLNDALRVTAQCPEKNPLDVSVLNLIAKCLLSRKETVLAREVAGRSLTRNPFQEDIERIRQRLEAGQETAVEVHLDTRPKLGPLCFYLPVYNVERFVRQAIEGILEQHHPVAEILVINDATQDGSIEIAREYPVNIIEHPENLGLAAARNTAFRHTACPYLAAIDTDARPEPDYAGNVMMEFENAEANLAGVGGMLVEQYTDTPPDAWRAKHLAQHWGSARLYPPHWLFGSNSVLRKDAVLDVGGYDERFRTNAEDVDICNRLKAEGYDLCYVPTARALHVRRDTLDSLLSTRWNYEFWYRRSHGFFAGFRVVVAHLKDLLDASIALVREDLNGGAPEFLYIDLLAFFYDALRNVRYCVQQNVFSPNHGRYLQDRVTGILEGLDPSSDKALSRRASNDLAHLLLDADDASHTLPAEDLVQLDQVLSGIQEDLKRLGEDFYRKLAADC